VIREYGRRLAAAGRLEGPDDVFYLTLEELRALDEDPRLSLRTAAAARRAEIARWAQYDEPLELGTRPEEPLYLYSADARRILRYVGGLAAEAAPPDPGDGVLHGQAGSPGKARGRVRLIRSLGESHRLQPGDILVTTTTAPPWTPLFLTAAAVVTDAGGLLSHGAVVSREYRIPAVVGTGLATTLLHDGQLIEVDGDRGLVRLLAA
jgi:pyruvate,water dikinase